ncbi:MAG: putative cell wall hydrolase LytN precursor [Chloroflexi bacterium ADurb.Bin180]|nr:MAG: putative cell wall hydrolase LytN precursor [Chloroflexi bacterium ADurb.Bin180]HOU23949.1 LysM domain-containing protein [Anaerolineae bacterium]HQJ50318.1 LysM domain-containing protein [Anaerolineae bacterium]
MAKLLRRSLLLAVLVLTLLLVAGATTVLADGYHIVSAGETLYAIGRRYGVNPYTIASVNNLANPDLIWVGQRLYIPSSSGWQAPRPPAPRPPPPPAQYPHYPYYPPQPAYSRYEYFNYWYCQAYGCPNYYWWWYRQ